MKKEQVNGFNTERTFGVEIEFLGHANAVAAKCRAMGIDCRVENYNHENREWWKIVTDASVNGAGEGLEIVSPILHGREGLEAVKTVCAALEAAGATVNVTCGLHVHHGAEDFNVNSFKNITLLYTRYEKTIDSLMPKSRRGSNNTYCASLFDLQHATFSSAQRFMEWIYNARDTDQLLDFFSRRFLKLNLRAYRAHSTVEFRQHSGTTEAAKVVNWILLTQAMVNKATERTVLNPANVDDSWKSFKKAVALTGYRGATEELQAVQRFYGKRRKQLA